MCPEVALDLFTARQGGYHNYRIPGIIAAPNGDLLAYCEARLGQGGDWDLIDILMRRSTDGGLHWDPAEKLVDHRDFAGGGLNNVVMIADTITGEVHALFCREYATVYAMKSSDNGHSFCDPVEITAVFEPLRSEYPWQVVALGPGHGIQLRGGRLIVPVWLSTSEGQNRHRPSVVTLIYSDDHGAHWQVGPLVARHGADSINPSETVAVELADGRLLFNIRNELMICRRLIATSLDSGQTWGTPAFDAALLEPQCMGSILSLGEHIVFTNPDNLDQTLPGARGRAYDRKRLTVKLSSDDCRTWPHSRVIEPGPAGYSDMVAAADGHIICFYERGYIERQTDTQFLSAARFTMAWIKENNADD